MDPAKRDAVFSQVQGYAKEFDRLLLELNRKLAGETEREPASTLDRLTKNATSMREFMQQELSSLKRHNDQLEKTTHMIRDTVKYKSQQLDNIKQKIKDYTVNEDDEPDEPTKGTMRKEGKRHPSDPEAKTKTLNSKATNESDKKIESRTPLKSRSDNTQGSDIASEDQESESRESVPLAAEKTNIDEMSTPPRSSDSLPSADDFIKTPKLTDYLRLDDMYDILDVTNLITKSSKKSSCKKSKSTPNLHQSAMKSASKSRKALLLEGTPGKSHLAADDTVMLTPIMPKLTGVERPKFLTLPKADFTGRIAMVDVVEFHSQVADYIKSLITLDMLNKVINRVDLMFQMDPKEPVETEALESVVTPLAGPKTRLCIKLLVHLNRIQPVKGGKDLMKAVLGKPSA